MSGRNDMMRVCEHTHIYAYINIGVYTCMRVFEAINQPYLMKTLVYYNVYYNVCFCIVIVMSSLNYDNTGGCSVVSAVNFWFFGI